MKLDRRLTLALIATLVIQAAGAFLWAGAAAERINALELELATRRPEGQRLARVEAQLEAIRGQLDRIERKLDGMD